MFHKIPSPDVRHFAVDIFQIFVRHRYPFRLAGGAAGGGIHVGFAGEKYVLLAVLVALNIRSQRLVTVVHRHILPIESKKILGIGGRQNDIEMMFAPIHCVARQVQNVAQRTLGSVARMPTPKLESLSLRTTCQPQREIYQPRIWQRFAVVVSVGLVFHKLIS